MKAFLAILLLALGSVLPSSGMAEDSVSLSAQVDDVFLASNVWGGGKYRLDAADVAALVAWQKSVQADPVTAGFRLNLAFNGAWAAQGEPLTEALRAQAREFNWISHGFTHLGLDRADYAATRSEIDRNGAKAAELGLGTFSALNLITAGHTGLANGEALSAMGDAGVRYVAGDTSYRNRAAPVWLTPKVFRIPRHPTELYYNVSTPEQWVAEFAHRHGARLTYAQLLDRESTTFFGYLQRGDLSPLMFHQANLRAYDGKRSLLGDLLDATFAKYRRVSSLPIRTLRMEEIGVAGTTLPFE
jgi:hypothetical protein